MKAIRLYGELGRVFGKIHFFDVNTPAEAIRALIVNFPEFENFMINSDHRKVAYRVYSGSVNLDESELSSPASKVIRIVPIISGASGAVKVIAGASLIAIGMVMTAYGVPGGNFFVSTGIALALGGVSQLLTKTPKYSPSDASENKVSYVFNGAQNTSQQGLPVPICYGQMIVGSAVISAGINVDQISSSSNYVDQLNYVYVYALNNENNFTTPPPENYFRKELVEYKQLNPDFDYQDTWYYRFHFITKVVQG